MNKFSLVLFFFFGTSIAGVAQSDMNWWNNRHNWDGQTSWYYYMNLQPGAMGPNALPVPDLNNGRINDELTILVAPEVHGAYHDFTTDLYLQLNIPIKKAVELRIWWVPIEYFKTDSVVRDSRVARTYEAQGIATGDVYIGTNIPLVRNHLKWPDIALSINLKTASGSGHADARYTDTPGYFFDLSFGKDYTLKNQWILRPYAMGGFYVYQTNRSDYLQNDAIMWGVGCDFTKNAWAFKLQATGYKGYYNDLDNPIVLRAEVNKKLEKSTLVLRLQQGNQSYHFTSVRAGVSFNLNKTNK